MSDLQFNLTSTLAHAAEILREARLSNLALQMERLTSQEDNFENANKERLYALAARPMP